MPDAGSKNDSGNAPFSGSTGTSLVRYGFTSDGTIEDRALGRGTEPVAVLVWHGMGQQGRYETISELAEAIGKEVAAENAPENFKPIGVHLSYEDGSFLARAELDWTDQAKKQHSVHVYEAYWAPLTEGRVTYRDTVLFLLSAAWNGWKSSKLVRSSTIPRLMFYG